MSPASYQTAPPRVGVLARAGNGTRTRDPNLGKVVLYQLSYSRVAENLTVPGLIYYPPPRSGGEGDRTPDLVNAIHALSQLSYAPAILRPRANGPAGTRDVTWAFQRCQAILRTFPFVRRITKLTTERSMPHRAKPKTKRAAPARKARRSPAAKPATATTHAGKAAAPASPKAAKP